MKVELSKKKGTQEWDGAWEDVGEEKIRREGKSSK
jgi:hypothetical protein